MARTIFQARQGLITKAKKLFLGGFDLNRFWKWMAGELNVPTFDACCDDADDAPKPVRFNDEDDALEYFDGEDWTVVPDDVALEGDVEIDGELSVTGDAAVTGSLTVSDGIVTDTIAEETAAAGVTADGVLLKDGGVTSGTQIAAFYPQVAQSNIAAAAGGAIPVTNYLTTINTDAGGDAFTLANGTVIGQMKKILLVVDGGGDGTVTPATPFAGGTVATFDDAGDYLILQWSGTAWFVQENSGVAIA